MIANNRDEHEKEISNAERGQVSGQEETEQYPSLKVVIPTTLCIYLVIFLAALDRTIIGVAIPAISNEFQSFDDIAWYEAAFLFTLCIFQLPMGKIYKYFPAKWTLAVVVMIFEVGSIVCAAAPTSNALIAGRAITGIGAAGIVVGGLSVITDLVPLRKRPKYQGFVGALFGLASIIGPTAGGAFTSGVSWRWCFWISVPIAGVGLLGLIFVLPFSPAPAKNEGTWLEIIKRFDPLGNLFLAPGVICILLALQWGDTKFPWNNARIIALLVVGSILLIAFVGIQFWVRENGTIPPRIIKQRSIAAATVVSLGTGAVLIQTTFYLPIYFQAIKGSSAANAGIKLLPYFLSTVIFVIACGIAISKIGYYTPWLIVGCSILIVGTALLTTFRVSTTTGQWIGYQIVVGAGIGLSLQQPANAAQTVLSRTDIATGLAIFQFCNTLGGTLFVTIAQVVLSNTLISRLAASLPGFDASVITGAGATDFRRLVAKDKLSTVLEAYNTGIDNVFYCALAAACLAFLGSLFFEWKSVRAEPDASRKAEKEIVQGEEAKE